MISYEPLIRFLCGGSVGIFDNLINFWEEYIKNEVAEGGHFEKNSHMLAAQKA